MSMDTPVPVPVVPAKLRFVLYWISWGLSTIAGLVSAAWQIIAAASDDVSAPLWVKLLPALLLLVVAQLNALAGSNVTNAPSLVVRRLEEGAASVFLLGLVSMVVGIFIVLLTNANELGWIVFALGVVLAVYGAVTDRRV